MPHKFIIAAIVAAFCASSVLAQSGPNTGTPTMRGPDGRLMTMQQTSLTFQAPPRQRSFQRGDIIYVHVRDRMSYSNTADNQRRQRVESEAALTAWTKFAGLFKMPIGTRQALPEIGGSIDSRTQNRGRLTREETLNVVVPSQVTDIRENGNLVIEGTRRLGIGEEGNIITIRGIVRPDSIRDGRVDSDQVAEFDFQNVPSGNVFDTVRRPWGTQLLERVKPF